LFHREGSFVVEDPLQVYPKQALILARHGFANE